MTVAELDELEGRMRNKKPKPFSNLTARDLYLFLNKMSFETGHGLEGLDVFVDENNMSICVVDRMTGIGDEINACQICYGKSK